MWLRSMSQSYGSQSQALVGVLFWTIVYSQSSECQLTTTKTAWRTISSWMVGTPNTRWEERHGLCSVRVTSVHYGLSTDGDCEASGFLIIPDSRLEI